MVVNSAGRGHRGILEEVTPDDLRQRFELDVFASMTLIQAVVPGMRAR